MRGAYEVGVILGIVDALKPQPGSAPLFRIFSGASVGAINTAYLAANAELPDHGIGRLAEVWKTLKLEDHARVRPLGLTGLEEFSIVGLDNGEAREVTVRADEKEFRATLRLDTPREREYLRHGGILPYVLRRLLAA